MKNHLKRLIVLVLAILMTVSMIACTGGNGEDLPEETDDEGKVVAPPDYMNMESDMPIVEEDTDITLKVMIQNGPYYQNIEDFNDIYFVSEYENRSNVKVEWVNVPSDSFDDNLAMMLASEDLPDVIMKGGISNSVQMRYGNQGYFLDLMENDLLENYAPNYWALAQEYSDILASSITPEGNVYSLGMIANSVGSLISSKMYFNKDWLEAVDMDVPSTSDELYDVLYAFKNNDPNQNGLNDEMGFYTSHSHLEYTTLGMFGLGNRGMRNGYIDIDQDGGARYFPTDDQYREWIEYVKKLRDEGLLNKEYYEFTEPRLGVNVMNDQVGAFAYTNLSMLDENTQQKMTYLDGALTGPDGHSDWYGTNTIGNTGAYIITTACEHPEVALRWADYFYSDEGSLFFYYGDVGVTAEENEDGTYRYSDEVLKDFYEGRNSYDGCAVYVSLYGYGHTPTKTQVPFNSADDNRGISLESAYGLMEDRSIAWPAFTFTREEERSITDINRDIDTYVKSMRDAWILGTTVLDDVTWNNYINTIERMGIDEVIDVYNNALHRAYDYGFEEGYYSADQFD